MFRTLSSLAVETISFMVIFTSEDVMNTVFNFIGLVIIDRFDVYVYDAVRCVNFKQCLQPELLEQLLRISFTTSSKALSGEMGEESDLSDEMGKALCNKIRFW